jgi:hypothetical protein
MGYLGGRTLSLAVVAKEVERIPLGVGGDWSTFLRRRQYELGELSVEISEVAFENGRPAEFQKWYEAKFGLKPGEEPDHDAVVSHAGIQKEKGRYPYGAYEKAWEQLREEWATQFQPNRDRWSAIISENVEFAISQYPRRHWPESFFDELRAMGQRHWMNSKYVTVRDKSGKIVGSLRFITSRDSAADFVTQERSGDLLPYPRTLEGGTWTRKVIPPYLQQFLPRWLRVPMEEGLGVNLERPILVPSDAQAGYQAVGLRHFLGEVIEPGNFAVDKNVNAEVYRAITIELMKAVYEETHSADYNANGKALYSYADAIGRRLYLPLGFELVDAKDPLIHDDVKWWIIRLTPERLKQWIENMEKRASWTPESVAEINQMLEVFSQPERISGRRFIPEGEANRHGLDGPVGYSTDARVKEDIENRKQAQVSAFQAQWQEALKEISASLPADYAGPYEKLLVALTVARAEHERLMPVWQDALVVHLKDGWPVRVETHGDVTPQKMEAWYGPLWQAKYVLDSMSLMPGRYYREHPEAFFSDLRDAMVEEMKDRASRPTQPFSLDAINQRLIGAMSGRAKARNSP